MTSPILPDKVLRLIDPAERAKLGKAGMTADEAAAKQEVRLERELHDLIGQLLNRNGITYGHALTHKKSTYTPGWPDFTFAVQGVPCVWEVKLPGEPLDPAQEEIRRGLLANGWHYAIIRLYGEAVEDLAFVKNVLCK